LTEMVLLINALEIPEPFYFLADAYYSTGKIIRGLIAKGNHLVSRVRCNAVAYESAAPVSPDAPRQRGRPKKYGKKIKVLSLLDNADRIQRAPSPIYDEKNVTIEFVVADLLWRTVGILVRFVVVRHPHRGAIVLMTTDTSLPALEIIRMYGLRFKIEVSFKQAVHTIGTYAYHFWMAAMTPLRRVSGNQYLHLKSKAYRDAVTRKLAAYHRHIQLGLIAQGLLHILAATAPHLIWSFFGSWFRTIRPGRAPSELVATIALRNALPEFLADRRKPPIFVKFLRSHIDPKRLEGSRLVA
jgi:hypothetical protein